MNYLWRSLSPIDDDGGGLQFCYINPMLSMCKVWPVLCTNRRTPSTSPHTNTCPFGNCTTCLAERARFRATSLSQSFPFSVGDAWKVFQLKFFRSLMFGLCTPDGITGASTHEKLNETFQNLMMLILPQSWQVGWVVFMSCGCKKQVLKAENERFLNVFLNSDF